MANGDCPIGAANKAYIDELQKGAKDMAGKQDTICTKIDQVKHDFSKDLASTKTDLTKDIGEIKTELHEFKLNFRGMIISVMVSLVLMLAGIVANLVINLTTNINGGL